MKTASIPSLRVEPELRQAAESLLEEGETLSSFTEQALRFAVARRRAQREFLERGLAARVEARRSGDYVPATEVLSDMDDLLRQVEERAGRR